VILIGARAREAVRELEAAWGRQFLSVSRGEKTVWVWLAGKSRLAVADIELPPWKHGTANVSMAIGEPGRGMHGWRLTHCQAQAALLVTRRGPLTITRYSQVMLLAAALRDDTLRRSLEEIYLLPLASQRAGGAVSRETLRRYFDANSNAATAAVVLGVDRHTVERRLRVVEKRLGRLLHTCQAELEVALHLHELGFSAGTDNASSPTR
jgi:sugar diacid utilization regulator